VQWFLNAGSKSGEVGNVKLAAQFLEGSDQGTTQLSFVKGGGSMISQFAETVGECELHHYISSI
jgi:hypothetical protein